MLFVKIMKQNGASEEEISRVSKALGSEAAAAGARAPATQKMHSKARDSKASPGDTSDARGGGSGLR